MQFKDFCFVFVLFLFFPIIKKKEKKTKKKLVEKNCSLYKPAKMHWLIGYLVMIFLCSFPTHYLNQWKLSVFLESTYIYRNFEWRIKGSPTYILQKTVIYMLPLIF